MKSKHHVLNILEKLKLKIWSILISQPINTIFYRSKKYQTLNKVGERKLRGETYSKYFKENLVIQGPFEGLKYPDNSSLNYRYLNKLAGTYETELHQIIKRMSQLNIKKIINVGSAEGYYTCGLTKLFANAETIAFDILESARTQTFEMAKSNNLTNRIHIREFAGQDELINNHIAGETLILIDCEGYEAELLNRSLVTKLTECYFLIETHDCFVPDIHKNLTEIFSESHNVESILSFEDNYRVKNFKLNREGRLSKLERSLIFSENRLKGNNWIYCSPK